MPLPPTFPLAAAVLGLTLHFPLLGPAPGSSSGQVLPAVSLPQCLGQVTQTRDIKFLQVRGGTGAGILNRSGMHFSAAQSLSSSCLLPPAVLGSYCSILHPRPGLQGKAGVTPKAALGRCQGTPWKRALLLLLPNHQMELEAAVPGQGRRAQPSLAAPVKPSLSVALAG